MEIFHKAALIYEGSKKDISAHVIQVSKLSSNPTMLPDLR